MEIDAKPNIVSFVIRFVQEQPDKEPKRCNYRGAILHVQRDHEILFTRWDDAINFIQQFVPIDQMSDHLG